MWSFWEKEYLIGSPDLVIVGGGIVGISTAVHFKTSHPSARVLVLEAGHLPNGASTKNAGFACFGSPSELISDLKDSAPDQVYGLVKRRYDGLTYLREWLGDEAIAYEAPCSYELFENQDSFESSCEYLSVLNKNLKPLLGFAPYLVEKEVISAFDLKGFYAAIRIQGEGQLNTGLMMKALTHKARAAGVEIINGLMVAQVTTHENKVQLDTPSGTLFAKQCLVTNNGFAQSLLPELEVKPARAQVLITTPIKNLKIRGTFHFQEGYYYFRNVDDRILFGGGRNTDFEKESTSVIDLNDEIQDHLIDLLKTKILPSIEFEVAHQWAGIMGVQNQKTPIIQSISDHLHCAVGMGGMGIAIGVDVGREAAELVKETSGT